MAELPPSSPDTQLAPPPPVTEFKPNIYPIMYWALAFGMVAGILLFLMNVLSQFITFVWFPIFLAGLIWGGYRNYQKQKHEWQATHGMTARPQGASAEFREAVYDIFNASRDLMTQEDVTPPPPPAEEPSAPEETPPQSQPPAVPPAPPVAPV